MPYTQKVFVLTTVDGTEYVFFLSDTSALSLAEDMLTILEVEHIDDARIEDWED